MYCICSTFFISTVNYSFLQFKCQTRARRYTSVNQRISSREADQKYYNLFALDSMDYSSFIKDMAIYSDLSRNYPFFSIVNEMEKRLKFETSCWIETIAEDYMLINDSKFIDYRARGFNSVKKWMVIWNFGSRMNHSILKG